MTKIGIIPLKVSYKDPKIKSRKYFIIKYWFKVNVSNNIIFAGIWYMKSCNNMAEVLQSC